MVVVGRVVVVVVVGRVVVVEVGRVVVDAGRVVVVVVVGNGRVVVVVVGRVVVVVVVVVITVVVVVVTRLVGTGSGGTGEPPMRAEVERIASRSEPCRLLIAGTAAMTKSISKMAYSTRAAPRRNSRLRSLCLIEDSSRF